MIDKNLIIADTGYLYALFNESDPHFFLAQRLLEHYDDNTFLKFPKNKTPFIDLQKLSL